MKPQDRLLATNGKFINGFVSTERSIAADCSQDHKATLPGMSLPALCENTGKQRDLPENQTFASRDSVSRGTALSKSARSDNYEVCVKWT